MTLVASNLLILLLTAIGAMAAFKGISNLISVIFGAPNVSTPSDVIKAALELAYAKPGETFLDLGCGWGKTLAVAQNYGLKAKGIDISPAAVAWNKFWGRQARWGNIKSANHENADIIYIYLLPKLVKAYSRTRLPAPKRSDGGQVLKNLRIDTRVVAVDFPLPSQKPTKTKKIHAHTIYLYGP